MNKLERSSFVSSESILPELSLKSVVIGILLAVVMGSVNLYLGLKSGSTITACIPASILGMSVLSLFKRHNILENNIIQTIASIGGSIASSSIFLPALVINNTWNGFEYFPTLLLLSTGAIFGVFLIVPLRKAFIDDASLQFPEGVATAEILKSGYNKSNTGSLTYIISGSLLGAIINFLQTGLQILGSQINLFINHIPAAYSIGLSPAVIATGIIVGAEPICGLFVGSGLAFLVFTPIITIYKYITSTSGEFSVITYKSVMLIWTTYVKNIGIGTMIVGGTWSVINLIKPIIQSVKTSVKALNSTNQVRTDQDINIQYVILGLIIGSFLLSILVWNVLEVEYSIFAFGLLILAVLLMVVIASAMASYLIGTLGSSHAPISGIFLISITFLSVIIMLLFHGYSSTILSSVALITACTCTISACISGENMQDLKTGSIIGATPKGQEISLLIGAIPTLLTMPLVYRVLVAAYGMEGTANTGPYALSVPKASMFAQLSRAIFDHTLQTGMISIGMALGIIVIILDYKFNNTKWNFSPFSIAIGMYMPSHITTAVAIGAFTKYYLIDKHKVQNENHVLMSAGIISGEAIIGVLLAIPFAIYGPDIIQINLFGSMSNFIGNILGLMSIILVVYSVARK